MLSKKLAKKVIYLKILSLTSLALVMIPANKFSLAYIIIILLQLFETQFSFESLCVLISIFGFVITFFRKKYYVIIGYFLAPFLLVQYLFYTSRKLDFYFWIPFVTFLVLAFYVLILSKKLENE